MYGIWYGVWVLWDTVWRMTPMGFQILIIVLYKLFHFDFWLVHIFFRYFAICHPHEYQRTKQALNPRIEVTLSLFLAFVIQLPHFLAKNVVNAPCRIPRFHFNSTTDVDPIVWENYSLYPLDHRRVHVNHLKISIFV